MRFHERILIRSWQLPHLWQTSRSSWRQTSLHLTWKGHLRIPYTFDPLRSQRALDCYKPGHPKYEYFLTHPGSIPITCPMCWQATAPLPVCQWWELGPDQRRSRRLDRWVHRPCQSLDAPRRATSADGSSCGGFRRRPPTRTRLVQHILRQVPNRFPRINTLNLTKSSSNPRICLLTLISSLGASLATKMCLNFAPPKRKERQEATITM